MLTLGDFKASKPGEAIGALLRTAEILAAMEALSAKGQPAVLAIDRALGDDIALDDTEKRHVGRWVRDELHERGWRVAKRLHFRSGRVFSSGAVYRRAPPRPSTAPATDIGCDDSWEGRIARVQAMVRAFSTNDYSVDDFIRDKRREAAREAPE